MYIVSHSIINSLQLFVEFTQNQPTVNMEIKFYLLICSKLHSVAETAAPIKYLISNVQLPTRK